MFLKLIKPLLFIILNFTAFNAIAEINTHFNTIKNNPRALYDFFKQMPKGGELHYHYMGSAYPEDLITMAVKGNYCINPKTFTISRFKDNCNGVLTKTFFANKKNRLNAIKTWSMKSLSANYSDRHDHFFNVFDKVIPIYDDFYKNLLAGMILRAADQNELYMEIIQPHFRMSQQYIQLIKNTNDLAKKKDILLANPEFQKNIQEMIAESNSYIKAAHEELKCAEDPNSPACKMVIKFQALVLREATPDDVFVQALAAVIAAQNSPNIVGINLAQPENGLLAKQEFNKQMEIFNFLHKEYKTVHIDLHAGELDRKTNSVNALSFHINESVYTGHAERIGHGTDIIYEKNNDKLLKYMAKNHIAVEINLISNKLILSIEGAEHPILYYLKHEVPVVLSTDDEGILQTNLTNQYVDAVKNYHLDYKTIKNINRNALSYNFLPGKSIWLNQKEEILVSDCRDLNSKKCDRFIKQNQKAALQWELEKRLIKFEQKF